MKDQTHLRQHVVNLLKGSEAHADFDAATANLPAKLRGERPKGAEHSPWDLVEHLRIAQWDILEYSQDPKHKSPEFPAGYWPKSPIPPSEEAWDRSVKAFGKDLKALCDLVANESTDLLARFLMPKITPYSEKLACCRSQRLPYWATGAGAAASRSVEVEPHCGKADVAYEALTCATFLRLEPPDAFPHQCPAASKSTLPRNLLYTKTT